MDAPPIDGDAVLAARPAWHRTPADPFGHVAWVDGRCWVLRLNDFPEHPLYTLFVDGTVVGDLDDPPPAWDLQGDLPGLDPDRLLAVVELMATLGPYGSEQGAPCDGDWCSCSVLTEEWIRNRDR